MILIIGSCLVLFVRRECNRSVAVAVVVVVVEVVEVVVVVVMMVKKEMISGCIDSCLWVKVVVAAIVAVAADIISRNIVF